MIDFDDDFGKDWHKTYYGGTGSHKGGSFEACHVSHKPLPLKDGIVIHGGSCINPKVKKADIYIGFDHGMEMTKRRHPWNGSTDVYFPITDRSVPKDVKEFKKLIEWTVEKLEAGKKVHAGCIGGHGRTGLFFAALVISMGISNDPIAYVRKNYCKKAVESKEQVEFLVTHFGAKTAEAKSHYPAYSGGSYSGGSYKGGGYKGGVSVYNGSAAKIGGHVLPVKVEGCVFGGWV